MATARDYLTAGALSLMRGADNSSFETMSDIREAFEAIYPAALDETRLNYLAKILSDYGFISVTADKYAGDYITPVTGWGVTYRLNKLKESDPDNGLLYVIDGGEPLLKLAYDNPVFWADVDEEIASPESELTQESASIREIPASDRLVSLSHNQFKEIDEPTGELLEKLDQDNGIPDQPGLKERIAGQIKAGRELLRAGEFQLDIFRATMLSGLAELKERYGDHAIGAAASALLTLILHIIGLPGF